VTARWRGFFWRVLDRFDYWIMRARLWVVDAACGPFADGDTPDWSGALPIQGWRSRGAGVAG
jgi:hypothetical protein